MKAISTKTHGILDYIMGVALIAAPFILGFNEGGAETAVPVVLGVTVILYSLFTRYEPGVFKSLPMITHLWLDGLGGFILAASPWIFGFHEQVFLPHLILGIAEIGAALMTNPFPQYVH